MAFEFTKEKLDKIDKKQEVKRRNLNYLKVLNDETLQSFDSRIERLDNCLSWWLWDKYEKNKLLDLKKVNRCKDTILCPNCRQRYVINNVIKFEKPFENLVKHYNPYLLTLTVPNVLGVDLEKIIDKMNKAFVKFFRWMYRDKLKGGYKERLFDFVACVKVLEITIEKKRNNYYHPHFHCIVFLKNDNEFDFIKGLDGSYDSKIDDYMKVSLADKFLQRLWFLAFNDLNIKEFNVDTDFYQVDIRELSSEKGIFEVFKYTYKDTDIKNYENFRVIFKALYKKRKIQSYGKLYNLKFNDDIEEKKEDSIEHYLQEEEQAIELLTNFQSLLKDYTNYKKISRFTADKYDIDD